MLRTALACAALVALVTLKPCSAVALQDSLPSEEDLQELQLSAEIASQVALGNADTSELSPEPMVLLSLAESLAASTDKGADVRTLLEEVRQLIIDQRKVDDQFVQEANDSMPTGADMDSTGVQEKLDDVNKRVTSLKVELEKFGDVTNQIKFLADLVESSKLSDDMRAEAFQKEKIVYDKVRSNGLKHLGQLNAMAGDYEEKTEWWKRNEANSEQLLKDINDLREKYRDYLAQWESLHAKAQADWKKVYSTDQAEISFFVQKHADLSASWTAVKKGYEEAIAEREGLMDQLALAEEVEAQAKADDNWEQRHWRIHLNFITDWYDAQNGRTDLALKTVNALLDLLEEGEGGPRGTEGGGGDEEERVMEDSGSGGGTGGTGTTEGGNAEAGTADAGAGTVANDAETAAKEATTAPVPEMATVNPDPGPTGTPVQHQGEAVWDAVNVEGLETNAKSSSPTLLQILETNAEQSRPVQEEKPAAPVAPAVKDTDLDLAMLELERFASIN